VVAIAIPLPAVLDLPAAPFTGRIVVDATNYDPEADGRLQELDADLTTGTLAESRRQQPGSSLYRAFAKARAAGETLIASRAPQLLAAAPEGRAVATWGQGARTRRPRTPPFSSRACASATS
jgi:8-hydroxy-5-deazaflavin:NADPH oxidoreductase